MGDRELRAELEALQAEARALADESAQPHGPVFLARRDEVQAALAPLEAELEATEAKLVSARSERARLEAEVHDLRERLRRAEELNLSWVAFALIPVVMWLGVRAAMNEAWHAPAACASWLGFGFLYGPRVFTRSSGPPAPLIPTPRAAVSGLQKLEGLSAALLLPLAALLTLTPLAFRVTRLEGPPDLHVGLAVGLVVVLLAERGRQRSKRPGHRGAMLSLVVLVLATGLVVVASGWALTVLAIRPWYGDAMPWILHGVATAAWSLMAVSWPLLRRWPRVSVGLSVAGAVVSGVALALVERPHGAGSYGTVAAAAALVVLSVQLAAFGLLLGVRGGRALETGPWRWSGAVASALAAFALVFTIAGW